MNKITLFIILEPIYTLIMLLRDHLKIKMKLLKLNISNWSMNINNLFLISLLILISDKKKEINSIQLFPIYVH